jgi:hypothetical protein
LEETCEKFLGADHEKGLSDKISQMVLRQSKKSADAQHTAKTSNHGIEIRRIESSG